MYDHSTSGVVSSNLIISGGCDSMIGEQDDELFESLKKFWETESVGIIPEDQSLHADKQKSDIHLNGHNYEIALHWKEDLQPSTNSYRMSESRLRSLYFKLKKDPDLSRDYDRISRELEQAGIVERVPEEETTSNVDKGQVYYSPHHLVIRKDCETIKVRIVYDGSAKSSKEELSLNNCLETGDNYIPRIFNMLARSRNNPVGLTSDIEKAFLMVSIKEEDQDMVRFLWFDNSDRDRPRIGQLRFNRLLYGLRPSPSILGATIAIHFSLYKQSKPEMAALLEKSLYVDNMLSGAGDDEKALEIYHKSKRIMADGGFNLRKWNSSSQTLLNSIEACEISEDQKGLVEHATAEDDESYAKSSTTPTSSETKKDTVVKILGMNWDSVEDNLFFNFNDHSDYGKSLPATKRSVLKCQQWYLTQWDFSLRAPWN